MSNFDRAHIFPKGSGNCSCPENIILLDRYVHKVLDGHITNIAVEHYKHIHREELAKEPKAYRHRIAFGVIFHKEWEIKVAIKHNQERNRGTTLCTKLKK